MNGRRLLIAALFASIAAMSTADRAVAAGICLGPQVGYYKAKGADDGELMYGAAFRMKLTPVIGVEASINYREEKYADDIVTVRSWPVMATGMIFPIPQVYGAMGIGWYNTTIDYDETVLPLLEEDTVQEIGWHFGGGVELPAGPVILTGDIRYVFIDYDFEEIPGRGETESNFYVITAGVLFGF